VELRKAILTCFFVWNFNYIQKNSLRYRQEETSKHFPTANARNVMVSYGATENSTDAGERKSTADFHYRRARKTERIFFSLVIIMT
jgi:hypothetical protein